MRAWQTKIDNTAPTDTGILSAAEDNARGAELANAVSTAGITPNAYNVGSDTDLYMLAQAMARYASGGIFAQDGGAANAYVLTTPLTFIMPKAYFEGMTVEFYPANTNTGASTANAFSIGSKKVLSAGGSALTGGELVAGQLTALVYDPTLDSSAGAFKIKPWAEAAGLNTNYKNLPFYPHVDETDNKLTVSNLGGGSLQIAASQEFVWRGWIRVETSDISSGDRTLSTLANKTYHVRWHAPDTGDATPAETYPNGRFRIKDLSDSGYNPSTLDEDNVAFDSTYDDMLVAKVVTDGSNVATITTLRNAADLQQTSVVTVTVDNFNSNNGAHGTISLALNWARGPVLVMPAIVSRSETASTDGDVVLAPATAAYDGGNWEDAAGLTSTRYAITGWCMWDYSDELKVQIGARA